MTPSKPYLIGLTGGIASGKSTLARALRAAGAAVIDADAVSRALSGPDGPALPPLREAFGDTFFEGDVLNRRALGGLVFSDRQALEKLNAIMHPMILSEVERQAGEMASRGAVILDAALLFEAGWDKRCDEVWCVWVPYCVQLRRVMRRDKLGLRDAQRRIASQMPAREKRRRADFVISTMGTRRASAGKALTLWREALRRADIA